MIQITCEIKIPVKSVNEFNEIALKINSFKNVEVFNWKEIITIKFNKNSWIWYSSIEDNIFHKWNNLILKWVWSWWIIWFYEELSSLFPNKEINITSIDYETWNKWVWKIKIKNGEVLDENYEVK